MMLPEVRLQAAFERVAVTRMAGLPLLHPGLSVETVGFRPCRETGGDRRDGRLGVLITPWAMNLIFLPAEGEPVLGIGRQGVLRLDSGEYDVLGAHEDSFGAFEMSSLFSPMSEFADQALARETAKAVLDLVRREPAASVERPSRRGFLLGRRA